jgi:hypothetical protein
MQIDLTPEQIKQYYKFKYQIIEFNLRYHLYIDYLIIEY